MNMPALALSDGYTREACFPSTDSQPGLWLVYRPLLAVERRRLALQTVWLGSQGPAGLDAAARLMAAALAARIVSWDLLDPAGNLREITPAVLLELAPALFTWIHDTLVQFEDEEAASKN